MSTFTWECPKCGHENAVVITNTSMFSKPQTMRCFLEDGGCDEMFAIQATPITTWEVKVFELVEVKE